MDLYGMRTFWTTRLPVFGILCHARNTPRLNCTFPLKHFSNLILQFVYYGPELCYANTACSVFTVSCVNDRQSKLELSREMFGPDVFFSVVI